jgi:hypothetical protein
LATHKQENTVRRTIKRVAPWLAAATIAGAVVFAPAASAAAGHVAPSPEHGTPAVSGASPFVPFGTWAPGDDVPYDPYIKNPGGGVDLAS